MNLQIFKSSLSTSTSTPTLSRTRTYLWHVCLIYAGSIQFGNFEEMGCLVFQLSLTNFLPCQMFPTTSRSCIQEQCCSSRSMLLLLRQGKVGQIYALWQMGRPTYCGPLPNKILNFMCTRKVELKHCNIDPFPSQSLWFISTAKRCS